MAGGFAHITAASEAIGKLREVEGLTNADKRAVTQWVPFIEVGSISPDYPYLGRQSAWADLMHYQHTGNVIRNGIKLIRHYEAGAKRGRCLAWLLGYAAHVATDLTIHPVVEARVGIYAGNKKEHRICEMNQDAFIWKRRNLGDIGLADYFRENITFCSSENGDLHPDIATLWRQMLSDSYPQFAQQEEPDFEAWNKGFRRIVDTIDDLGSFVAFTRHMLASQGIAYPGPDEIDLSCIEALGTPEGPMHYNDIFDRAVASIVEIWSVIGRGLHANTDEISEAVLAEIPDGNLDTGRSLVGGNLIYWKVA